MADKFIVEGALCTCQFGTTPARIKVLKPTKCKMNGGKKVVDSMNLGPCFDAPMFTMCNMVPNAPKPCAAAVTQWSGGYSNIKISHVANPLLPNSKGTCALGVPQCISFSFEGQIGMPSMPQMKAAATESMNDMDPCSESLAMNDAQIGAFKEIKVSSSGGGGKKKSQKDGRVQAKDATGLTPEQKAELKKDPPGWSDKVVDQLISKDEADIYVKAGLKEVEVNGKACLIRSDIDWDQKDDKNRSNKVRVAHGLAPLDADGNSIELHHIGQKSDAGLAELTNTEHHKLGNDTVLHNKKKKSEIDRPEFNGEREDHWKSRSKALGKGPETS